MPDEKLDFAPSKGLAMLTGLGKGIADEIKRRKEAEAQRIQGESSMLRQIFPTLFMEMGRERRFGQEQALAERGQQWKELAGLLGAYQKEEELEMAGTAAERAETEAAFRRRMTMNEFDMRLNEFDLKLEDTKRSWQAETDKSSWEKQKFYMEQNIDILQSLLDSYVQMIVQGTPANRADIAEKLIEVKGAVDKGIAEMGIEARGEEAEAGREARREEAEADREARREEAERKEKVTTAKEWRAAYQDFEDSRMMDAWTVAQAEGDRDMTEALAPRIGDKLRRLYESWLLLPEGKRPPQPDTMREYIEEYGLWRRERPAWEITPREEGLELPARPTSMTDVLTRYGMSDREGRLESIRAMDEPAKGEAWRPYYRWLRDNGVSEEDIAKIEKALGIK